MYEVYMWADGAPNTIKVFEAETFEECLTWIEEAYWSYGIHYDVWKDDERIGEDVIG